MIVGSGGQNPKSALMCQQLSGLHKFVCPTMLRADTEARFGLFDMLDLDSLKSDRSCAGSSHVRHGNRRDLCKERSRSRLPRSAHGASLIRGSMSITSTKRLGNRTDRRGHHPAHEPTEASRKQVEALASYGVPQEQIAKVIGISDRTLRTHYADVLATAAIRANSLVAQSLFTKATKGEGSASVTAAIFWLKTRARWRERHEITGLDGGPIQMMDLSGLSDAQLAALEPVLRALLKDRDMS